MRCETVQFVDTRARACTHVGHEADEAGRRQANIVNPSTMSKTFFVRPQPFRPPNRLMDKEISSGSKEPSHKSLTGGGHVHLADSGNGKVPRPGKRPGCATAHKRCNICERCSPQGGAFFVQGPLSQGDETGFLLPKLGNMPHFSRKFPTARNLSGLPTVSWTKEISSGSKEPPTNHSLEAGMFI